MKQIVDNIETREEFKNFIEKNKNQLIIVKASATWCGPCKRIKDDFLSMFNNMPDNVILIELDIDEADDVAQHLKIRKVPTIMNFVNGLPMDIYTTSDVNQIKQFFDKCNAHLSMGF